MWDDDGDDDDAAVVVRCSEMILIVALRTASRSLRLVDRNGMDALCMILEYLREMGSNPYFVNIEGPTTNGKELTQASHLYQRAAVVG